MLFLSRVVEKLHNLKAHPLETRESSEENRTGRLRVCAAVGSTCALLGGFLESEWLEAEGWVLVARWGTITAHRELGGPQPSTSSCLRRSMGQGARGRTVATQMVVVDGG